MSATFFRLPFMASICVNISLYTEFIFLTGVFHAYSDGGKFAATVIWLLIGILIFSLHAYDREWYIRSGFLAARKLQMEEEKSQRVLAKMLPLTVIDELRAGAEFVYKKHTNVSVLFSHICDFDAHTANMTPRQVIALLNNLFSRFDTLTDEHKVYKVETIGDVYLVSAGVPDQREDHAAALTLVALAMMRAMSEFQIPGKNPIQLRIGINSGSVIAGVVGMKYPRYRLMGDTVNTASRMSTTCDHGDIQLSASTYVQLPAGFECVYRGEIAVKGKGMMKTYLVKGHTPSQRLLALNSVKAPRNNGHLILPLPTFMENENKKGEFATPAVIQEADDASENALKNQISPASTDMNKVAGVDEKESQEPPRKTSLVEYAINRDLTAAKDLIHGSRPNADVAPPDPLKRNDSDSVVLMPADDESTTTSTPRNNNIPSTGKSSPYKSAKIFGVEPQVTAATVVKKNSPRVNLSNTSELQRQHALDHDTTHAQPHQHHHISPEHAVNHHVPLAHLPNEHHRPPPTTTTTTAPISVAILTPPTPVMPAILSARDIYKISAKEVKVNPLFNLPQWELLHNPKKIWNLEFYQHPELEAQFQDDYYRRFLFPNRRGLSYFCIALLLLGIHDTLLNQPDKPSEQYTSRVTWYLRIIATVVGALTLATSYAKPDKYRIWQQKLTSFAWIVMGCFLTEILILFRQHQQVYGITVILLMLTASSHFIGLQFAYAAVVTTVILGFYLVSASVSTGEFPFVVFFLLIVSFISVVGSYSSEYYLRRDFIRFLKHRNEERRTRHFLDNMLPRGVIADIKSEHTFIAHEFEHASVLLSDIVSFTTLAARISPEDVVAILNVMFSTFDALTTKHRVYKVETIGDAYLACSGVVQRQQDHTIDLIKFALDMQASTKYFQTPDNCPIVVRIGIHTGNVVAGVVGRKMPRYHLFGETVTLAEEMEQKGVPGGVAISSATLSRVGDAFDVEPLPDIHIPNIGGESRTMSRYRIVGPGSVLRAQLQREGDGTNLRETPAFVRNILGKIHSETQRAAALETARAMVQEAQRKAHATDEAIASQAQAQAAAHDTVRPEQDKRLLAAQLPHSHHSPRSSSPSISPHQPSTSPRQPSTSAHQSSSSSSTIMHNSTSLVMQRRESAVHPSSTDEPAMMNVMHHLPTTSRHHVHPPANNIQKKGFSNVLPGGMM